ncbi:fibroblast growth factor receptor 4-like [Phymastichus coffea]|uniref:fibroblast growth factor receptor 4-like n=1 Tax=Phymastichus coffea TaxID=108790 RepID=UPI00273C104D|nr:fibroblast growth factor receptor 4-like [Phymastichus coffea]
MSKRRAAKRSYCELTDEESDSNENKQHICIPNPDDSGTDGDSSSDTDNSESELSDEDNSESEIHVPNVSYRSVFESYTEKQNLPDLVVHLNKCGLRSTGTVRKDRVKQKHDFEKKAPRGTNQASYDRNSEMNLISVIDSKEVSILSTASGVTSLEPMERYSRTAKKRSKLEFPCDFSSYNKSSLMSHPSIDLLRPPIIRLPSIIHPDMQSQQLLRLKLKTGFMNLNPNKLRRIYSDDQIVATMSTEDSKFHFEVGSSISPPDQNTKLNLMLVCVVCVIVLCFGIGTWTFRKWCYATIKLSEDNKWNMEMETISEIQIESRDLQQLQNKETSQNSNPFLNSNQNIKIKHINDQWEFPRHKLKVSTILGEGYFGQVWKCEALEIHSCTKSKIVAVKTLKENATECEKLDFIKELKIMKILDPHPNVVRLLGCCTERDPIFIILEYVSGGKLQSFLRTFREDRNQGYFSLTSRDLTSFVYQIAKGMENLASKCIIHRDLAARNVLIDENRVCKVADFGFARDVTADLVYERKSEGRLPIRWMAPESLFDNIFSVKSDVWSFGIIIWEIITLGSTPYPGLAAAEVVKRIKEGCRLDRPEHCKRELYNIMYYCWDKEPSHRPSFSELVKLLEGLLLNEIDYIELDRFPDHSYYNVINLSGEKL